METKSVFVLASSFKQKQVTKMPEIYCFLKCGVHAWNVPLWKKVHFWHNISDVPQFVAFLFFRNTFFVITLSFRKSVGIHPGKKLTAIKWNYIVPRIKKYWLLKLYRFYQDKKYWLLKLYFFFFRWSYFPLENFRVEHIHWILSL